MRKLDILEYFLAVVCITVGILGLLSSGALDAYVIVALFSKFALSIVHYGRRACEAWQEWAEYKQYRARKALMQRAVASPTSPLLRLPPELRLHIWSYVLPRTVTLSKGSPKLDIPNLCSTSLQVFQETVPLLVYESTWLFQVDEIDGAFTCKSADHLVKLAVLADPENARLLPMMRAVLKGTPRWENLLEWAKVVHAGGFRLKRFDDENEDEDEEAEEEVDLALRVADKLQTMPWNKAEEVLLELPAARDPNWT